MHCRILLNDVSQPQTIGFTMYLALSCLWVFQNFVYKIV